MTRDEFMKELAYLLQDIQDEDKEDAVQYYRDYFDEAGPHREEEVINEFGSPERIASIIRADINGHLENGGEFTERGYQDERFRDPGHEIAPRMDLPEEPGNAGSERNSENHSNSRDRHDNRSSGSPQATAPRTSIVLKIILWGVLIIVGLPIALGVGGGLLGLAAGVLGVLVALLISLALLTIAALIGGIALVPYGIVHMFANPLNGIMMSGTGLIFLGTGALCLALSLLFYGRFVPYVIRGIVNSLNRLFHRGR